MCGTAKKTKLETAIQTASKAFFAKLDELAGTFQDVTREARLLEKRLEERNGEIKHLEKQVELRDAAVQERDRVIVNLEARLADADQRILPVDADIAGVFAERDVDTSGETLSQLIAATASGHAFTGTLAEDGHEVGNGEVAPQRRGRVAIEAYNRACGGGSWDQIDAVDAGGEEDLIKFLKSEGETRELRAVTILDPM